jgi:hypothetical protein
MFSKLGKARNEKWQGKIFLVNQLILVGYGGREL